MQAKIQKWGNSLAVRIPKLVAEEAGVENETNVDLSFSKGKIVMIPQKEKEYSLDDLIAGINKNNLHEEVDFGEPEGKEIW